MSENEIWKGINNSKTISQDKICRISIINYLFDKINRVKIFMNKIRKVKIVYE